MMAKYCYNLLYVFYVVFIKERERRERGGEGEGGKERETVKVVIERHYLDTFHD